jgi:hypothetical protein
VPDAQAIGFFRAYARSSVKYLAAIDSMAKASRYVAEEDGRTEARRADIQRAMREGVIPFDRSLASVIQSTEPKRRKAPLTANPVPLNEPLNAPEMGAVGSRGGLKSTSTPGRSLRPTGEAVAA